MLVSGWLKVWKKRRRNTRSSYCRSWHYHTLGVALWWPWCAPNSDKLSTFSHLPRSCRREAMRKSGGDSFPSRPLLIVCACVSWLQSQAHGFFVSNVTKPPNDTPLRNSVRELPRRPSSKGAKDYGRDGDGEGWSTTTAVRTGRSWVRISSLDVIYSFVLAFYFKQPHTGAFSRSTEAWSSRRTLGMIAVDHHTRQTFQCACLHVTSVMSGFIKSFTRL